MPRSFSRKRDAAPRPLDQAALEALAIAYVGRFATTRAKLAAYLARKLAERGWHGDRAPDPQAVAERCATLGYLDDRGWASARGASLGRRGYGLRRVAEALRAAGVDEADAAPARAASSNTALAAALALARRRRIGPFAATAQGPDELRKAIATLVRGGHDFSLARRVAEAAPGVEMDDDDA